VSANLDSDEKVRKCEDIVAHLEEIEERVRMNTGREGKQLLVKMMGAIEKAREYLERTK
jgi:hypothetical protein